MRYIVAPGQCIHLDRSVLRAGDRIPDGLPERDIRAWLALGVIMEPPRYAEPEPVAPVPAPAPAPVDDVGEGRMAAELAEAEDKLVDQAAHILDLEMALRERNEWIASLEAEIATLRATHAPMDPEPAPEHSEPVKRAPGRSRRG